MSWNPTHSLLSFQFQSPQSPLLPRQPRCRGWGEEGGHPVPHHRERSDAQEERRGVHHHLKLVQATTSSVWRRLHKGITWSTDGVPLPSESGVRAWALSRSQRREHTRRKKVSSQEKAHPSPWEVWAERLDAIAGVRLLTTHHGHCPHGLCRESGAVHPPPPNAPLSLVVVVLVPPPNHPPPPEEPARLWVVPLQLLPLLTLVAPPVTKELDASVLKKKRHTETRDGGKVQPPPK